MLYPSVEPWRSIYLFAASNHRVASRYEFQSIDATVVFVAGPSGLSGV